MHLFLSPSASLSFCSCAIEAIWKVVYVKNLLLLKLPFSKKKRKAREMICAYSRVT